MQIPVGNFGYATPQAAPQVNIPAGAFGGDVAEAGARLGQVGEQIAIDQMRLQRVQAETQMRAKAALTLATVKNDMHDAHDQVGQGVLDGSIPTDQAGPQFDKRIADIKKARLGDLTENHRMAIEDDIALNAGALGRSLNNVVIKRKQSETGETIDQFGEQAQRDAMRIGPKAAADKYGALVDFAGSSAGWPPEIQAKKKQAFLEHTTAAFYNGAGVAALTKGDDAALGELVTQVQGNDALDPTRKAQIAHQLYGWQQHILAQRARDVDRFDREQQAREVEAVKVFNSAADLQQEGQFLSPETITHLTTTAAGTAMAARVPDLLSSQQAVAGFAAQPADQRQAVLNQMRARGATQGVGTDPTQFKQLQGLERIDASAKSAANENPWEAAQKYGVIKEAPLLNAANPIDMINVLRTRMGQIGQVESWAGGAVSPMQPKEAEGVTKMLRSLPIDQAATLLATMGTVVGDRERIDKFARQLGDKDGNLGLAMVYASTQTSQGRYTAELILRGEQALKDKTVTIDPSAETGWKGSIATAIRGAYSDRRIEDQAINAAYLIMVARNADKTQSGADVDNAVRLATGGIVQHGSGKVPLPYGMDESTFNKRIDAITTTDIGGQIPGGVAFAGRTSITAQQLVDSLPKASLTHAGQGRYNIKAGNYTVTNVNGDPITLDFK